MNEIKFRQKSVKYKTITLTGEIKEIETKMPEVMLGDCTRKKSRIEMLGSKSRHQKRLERLRKMYKPTGGTKNGK